MPRTAPFCLQHGPLTVYLQPLSGCLSLIPIVRTMAQEGPLIWLDSARSHPVTGRWSLVGGHPWLTLRARGDGLELHTSASSRRWRANPLAALRETLDRYRTPARATPQGRGIGLLGFLSYDLNRYIERLPEPQPSDPSVPEMLWYGMKTVVLVDHLLQRSWLLSIADPHAPVAAARREALEAMERLEARLGDTTTSDDVARSPGRPVTREVPFEATSTQAEFETMVRRALEYIRAGDIFQANVAQRFTAPWRGDALPLYLQLRRINPSPFACFLASEELSVVSCSPERLVRVQEGRIDTRPIAGTRPRGATPEEDAVRSLELLLSEKERAEHIMLVDLARNDLGRVCAAGSVAVNELMALEEYSHVIHIVSDVAGELRNGCDAADVIRAVFPGGTITGCPKVRCMQILRELEPVARGLYTGSLGVIGFDGTMDLNIAIRTMVVRQARASFHVGAGIVADSEPEREYHETLAKAGALMQAVREAGTPESWADAAAR
ncbi:MAG: aminodeoxychorismate synthase, component I [Candidatus Omnitrophica bacterium]|nr:aminodeoxychorismate synthase, component I [Candidatus Omnitrophota bacterium]